MESPLGYLHR